MGSDSSDYRSEGRIWNHQPELPVARAPLFTWPPRPLALSQWYARSWLAVSTSSCLALLAVVLWTTLQAPISSYQEFEFAWLLETHIRNLCLMTAVAGGLHLYLYTFRRQADELKFDPRHFETDHRRFTFNNQVFDNIFWTLASGVTFWTVWECVMMWGYANGQIPMLTWNDNPVWFVLLFPLLAMFHDLHFYFVHRALHWPPMYRMAHAVHHRNSNTGPWSGISMHPLEHAVYFTSLLIHVVLPTHPVHLLFHLYWLALAPAVSHSGYAGILAGGKNRFVTGSFYHQLHHRFYDCNYATAGVPIDVLTGSFHDGTQEGDACIRKKRMPQRRR